MKKKQSRRGLHLVTPEEAAAIRQQAATAAETASLLADKQESPASDPETDPLIASGIRRYQELQQKFDRELFRLKDTQLDPDDVDYIGSVLSELQLLRERLAHYGVHVRL